MAQPQKRRRPESARRANRIIQSRTLLLLGVFGVLTFVLLFTKLYHWQITKHEELQSIAVRQQTLRTTVDASRGTIYDKNGDILALSSTAENVCVSPLDVAKNEQDQDLIANGLGEILGVDPSGILDDMKDTASQYKVIKKKVEQETADKVRVFISDNDIKGVFLEPTSKRYYPYSSLAAHVIGFVNANGGKLVVVPADTKAFQIHLDEVEKRITKNTQGIIINSPNNPSGVVYTEETLKGLAALLERKSKEYGHPIYIIADEPYRELVYGGVKVPFIPCLYKNTIVCYSYSKSLSLPGERIGYVYVPGFAEDADAVYAAISGAARIMGHVCPPTLMQKVIEYCAEERPDLVAYDENRNLLYSSLREMGYECAKPDGAFYLFVKAPNGDANAFSEKAKLEHNLLVVPADGFGCPGYFRLSYCVANDMIQRSLPAFKAMIESYK